MIEEHPGSESIDFHQDHILWDYVPMHATRTDFLEVLSEMINANGIADANLDVFKISLKIQSVCVLVKVSVVSDVVLAFRKDG